MGTGGLKKFGEHCSRSPWDGGLAHSLETHSYTTCYHTKFGRSRSNCLGIVKGVPKKIGNVRECSADLWYAVVYGIWNRFCYFFEI